MIEFLDFIATYKEYISAGFTVLIAIIIGFWKLYKALTEKKRLTKGIIDIQKELVSLAILVKDHTTNQASHNKKVDEKIEKLDDHCIDLIKQGGVLEGKMSDG